MKITLTRDSVSAGDDSDAPHERQIKVCSATDSAELIQTISYGYLPHVAGEGHSWICLLNGKPIAKLKNGKVHAAVPDIQFASTNDIFFEYSSATS